MAKKACGPKGKLVGFTTLTPADVERIQQGITDCLRPGYHHEYLNRNTPAHDSTQPMPDPFGIDHSKVRPM